MGKVLVITSGKGGVGKTTTTANLGSALAMLGHKVVVLDADIGLRNLDVIMGLENRIVYDIIDVAEGVSQLKQALIKDKKFDELYLLPAAQTRDKNSLIPEQMRRICNDLAAEFDFVLVDSPAGIEQGFQNAIAGASHAVIVTTPEVSAVRDADRIIGMVESGGISSLSLVVNRIKPHMVEQGDMMEVEDVLEILSINLLGVIPDDEKIVVTSNRGEPAVLDKNSMAGQAYQNIARRILGEEVPLMEIRRKRGFFSRLLHSMSSLWKRS